MRTTRTEVYTMEHHRTVATLTCNACGTVADDQPMGRPEGWHSLFHQEEGRNTTFDFCEYECLYGFVMAHEDGLPTRLQMELEASVAQLTEVN